MIIAIGGISKAKKTKLGLFLKQNLNCFVINLDLIAKQILKNELWVSKIQVKNFQKFFKNNFSYYLFNCFSFNCLFNFNFCKILNSIIKKIYFIFPFKYLIIEGVLALQLNLNQKIYKIYLNQKNKTTLQFLQKTTIFASNLDLKIKYNFINKYFILKKIKNESSNW